MANIPPFWVHDSEVVEGGVRLAPHQSKWERGKPSDEIEAYFFMESSSNIMAGLRWIQHHRGMFEVFDAVAILRMWDINICNCQGRFQMGN